MGSGQGGPKPSSSVSASSMSCHASLATAEQAATSAASLAAAEPPAASPATAREAMATASSSSPTEPFFLAVAFSALKSVAALICYSLNSANALPTAGAACRSLRFDPTLPTCHNDNISNYESARTPT